MNKTTTTTGLLISFIVFHTPCVFAETVFRTPINFDGSVSLVFLSLGIILVGIAASVSSKGFKAG